MKPLDANDILRERGSDGLRKAFDTVKRSKPIRATNKKPTCGNGADIAAAAGAALLDEVRSFLCRFISYPSEHAAIAHALWTAHAHLMSAWESTPRLAFLSPEPGSGKTRALEVTQLLVPNPIATMNASSAYLFRRCGNRDDGTPTILFDEIDALFGPKAKENEDIRAFINSGHRRGATCGRCVRRGKTIETEDFESYAAVALAGLGWLPDTIMSRSVVIRMRRRAPDEHVDEFRHRVHAPVGKELCRRLAAWAGAVVDAAELARPDMPIGVEDRNADMWEPLFAVADLAGGKWPDLARKAAVALIAAGRETPNSLNLLLLSDLRTVFENNKEAVRKAVPEGLSTKVILEGLHALEDASWRDLKGKPLDANRLAVRLRHYEVRSQNLRPDGTDTSQCKGYHLADLADVWRRYLPPSPIVPSQPSQASQARYFQEDIRDDSEAEAVPSGSQPSREGENLPKKPMSGTAGTAGTALAGGRG
jgi:hypothetical protein